MDDRRPIKRGYPLRLRTQFGQAMKRSHNDSGPQWVFMIDGQTLPLYDSEKTIFACGTLVGSGHSKTV